MIKVMEQRLLAVAFGAALAIAALFLVMQLFGTTQPHLAAHVAAVTAE